MAEVASLFDEGRLREEVLTGLLKDRILSESGRAFVRQAVQAGGEQPMRLRDAAWDVVATQGAGKEAYALALRRAEAAVRPVPPEDSYMLQTLLGAAQYRAGQYAEAVATLTKFKKLNAPAATIDPWDLAFLAMARHRLGKKDEARVTLGRLRESMKRRPWATADVKAQAFLREAEELIEGRPGGKKR